jgi:hypothetical protein
MPRTWRVPGNDVVMCPECQGDLSFSGSWSFRDLWGYTEVRTYECPAHGPIFISRQTSVRHGLDKHPDNVPDNDDRDSLIPAPRKPSPTLDAGAVAIPEPDSN